MSDADNQVKDCLAYANVEGEFVVTNLCSYLHLWQSGFQDQIMCSSIVIDLAVKLEYNPLTVMLGTICNCQHSAILNGSNAVY